VEGETIFYLDALFGIFRTDLRKTGPTQKTALRARFQQIFRWPKPPEGTSALTGFKTRVFLVDNVNPATAAHNTAALLAEFR
jgi:hypothetical protein